MADDPQAIDLPPLPLQGLGQEHRIASPAGHQPDAAGRAMIRLSRSGEGRVRAGKVRCAVGHSALTLTLSRRERGLRLGVLYKFLDRRLQPLQLLPHLRQAADQRLLDFLLAFRRGGDADHAAAVGHVVGDARHGPQDGAIADVDVIADAHLPGHDHVIAGGGAAGDAHLRAEHVVAADAAIVGDHDQVVDLRPLADHGGAVGAAIDGRAGADLDVGAQLDVAQLGRQPVAALDQLVAEPVGPQHRAGVNQAAGADHRIFVQHHVGEDGHMLADPRAGHDVDAGVDRRAGADLNVVADGGQRINVHVVAQFGRRADAGLGADADARLAALRLKEGHHSGKRPVGVLDLDGGQAGGGERAGGDHRRGPAGGQVRALFPPSIRVIWPGWASHSGAAPSITRSPQPNNCPSTNTASWARVACIAENPLQEPKPRHNLQKNWTCPFRHRRLPPKA